MRLSNNISVLLYALTQLFGATAFAQQLVLVPGSDYPADEPGSVQISWVEPCENGNWLFDTVLGCRMWDWHPDPHDKASWSGSCRQGQKEGPGVVQWFEHGRPIDRFEGIYRANRREGFGRYVWNASDRFEGHYANGVPRVSARRILRARCSPASGAMAACARVPAWWRSACRALRAAAFRRFPSIPNNPSRSEIAQAR